jgi:Kef-type K+ transport system membrane component KefB
VPEPAIVAAVALAAEPVAVLTEDITARVFLEIAIIIVVARLAGAAARRVRQPAVVGEIIAGIMLGPSLLGLINEDLPTDLFPLDTRPFLGIIAQLGLIIFMFIVGLELDMGLIRGKGRVAAVTSISSVVLPFALGLLASIVLWDAYGVVNGEEVEWLHFALFIGASMSVTAFPVLARILNERRMHRTRLGVLTLACAAVDDVLAWSLLAAVLAVVGEGHLDPQWVVLLTLVYGAGMILLVRPLLVRVVARYQAVGRLTPDILAVILVGILVSSFLTSEIGIHAIFGAFFFGAILPREGAHQLFHEILDRLELMTVLLLLPVFFVVTGLNVDITGLGTDGLGYLLLVLAVACAGKFIGATLGSRSQGVPPRQAMAIGVLMNTRGLTELVILTIGREVGVLNDEMFTIMVVMAVFTTVITEPLLRLLYPDELVDREIAEAERIGSAEAEAYRVLVGTPEYGPGNTLAAVAAELTSGEEPREVALVQFGDPAGPLEVGSGIEKLAGSLDALHDLEATVEAAGVPVFARSRVDDDPGQLLGVLADESVADVILVPDDPSYTPPGATMAPAAPTAVLSIPSGGSVAAEDDVIVHLHGGGADAHALNVAVRLASARGRPLRIGGSGANRRVNASVERLRSAGIAVDDDGGGGLHVDGGAAAPSRPEAATLWLRSGRDDGIEPLQALVDRVTRTIPADGG